MVATIFFKSARIGSVIAAVLALSSSHAWSQVGGTTAPEAVAESRLLIVEATYPFDVKLISAPMPEVASSVLGRTPEETLALQFQAMRSLDWNAFLRTWEAPTAQGFENEVATKRRNLDEVRAQWTRSLRDARVMLTAKINFRDYILIEYSLTRPDLSKPLVDTVAFKKTDGGWKMTQELSKHPILSSWKSVGGRVRLPPDTFLDQCFH